MVFIYSYAVYGDNVKDAVLLSSPVLTDMGLFNTLLVQFGLFLVCFAAKVSLLQMVAGQCPTLSCIEYF